MDRPRGRGRTPTLNEDKDWLAQALADTGRHGNRDVGVTIARSVDALTKAMVGIGVELRGVRGEINGLEKRLAGVEDRLSEIDQAQRAR